MGLIDDFEHRLERVVEGAFTKVFKSQVQPSEIGRRMLREMEGGKSVSVGAVYVPNGYEVRLAQEDYDRFEGLLPKLRTEFITLLKDNARDRKWRPAGPLTVEFIADEQIGPGRFEVQATHAADAPVEASEADAPALAPARLELIDAEPPQTWDLRKGPLTIGRSPSNDVVLADANASRAHAHLTAREGTWWVEDLGSTNGTFVNETLVKEKPLTAGDVIRIGTSEFKFHPAGGEA